MSLKTLWDQQLDRRGSTRAVALIRIALVLICWARWATELMFVHRPERWPLSLSFFLCSTALLIGWRTRLANVLFAAVLWWMYAGYGFGGGVPGWAHHHTYLLVASVTWLAFTPSGRSFSIDRWLTVRRARVDGRPVPPEEGPLWGTVLLAAQCSAVYLFSAWDKTNLFFLSGDHLVAILQHFYTGSDPIELPGFQALCTALAVATVVLEYLLPVGLFVRRWQRWLVPVGLALHAIFFVVLPVSTFSVTMAVLYLAYLDPEAVHRTVDELTA